MKTWVLILHNDGRIAVWRDYGGITWGSPVYTVLGYFEGNHHDAIKAANTSVNNRS